MQLAFVQLVTEDEFEYERQIPAISFWSTQLIHEREERELQRGWFGSLIQKDLKLKKVSKVENFIIEDKVSISFLYVI